MASSLSSSVTASLCPLAFGVCPGCIVSDSVLIDLEPGMRCSSSLGLSRCGRRSRSVRGTRGGDLVRVEVLMPFRVGERDRDRDLRGPWSIRD